MANAENDLFVLITAIMDGSAGAAAVTQHHGEAYERAMRATQGQACAGMDLVELAIAPKPFAALRKQLQMADDTVAVYDLFPISAKADAKLRPIAGQYLAAQVLWTLDKQGLLASVPLSVKLDVPRGWNNSPEAVAAKLEQAQILNLPEAQRQTFKLIKAAWDSPAT